MFPLVKSAKAVKIDTKNTLPQLESNYDAEGKLKYLSLKNFADVKHIKLAWEAITKSCL